MVSVVPRAGYTICDVHLGTFQHLPLSSISLKKLCIGDGEFLHQTPGKNNLYTFEIKVVGVASHGRNVFMSSVVQPLLSQAI